MAKKKTKQMSLHDMAVRLCEGGVVEFNSLFLKAMVVPYEMNECDVCRMDCLCHDAIINLCSACNDYDRRKHLLYLANEQPPLMADSGGKQISDNNKFHH